MATGGWMDRVKAAVTSRGTDVVARVSQKALDAIEAMEKVEGAITQAPDKLKALRAKATANLEPLARRVRSQSEGPATRTYGARAVPSEDPSLHREQKAPELRKQAAPKAKAATSERAEPARRTVGRKTVASTSAPKQVRKPEGPKVKRGQKHRHHR